MVLLALEVLALEVLAFAAVAFAAPALAGLDFAAPPVFAAPAFDDDDGDAAAAPDFDAPALDAAAFDAPALAAGAFDAPALDAAAPAFDALFDAPAFFAPVCLLFNADFSVELALNFSRVDSAIFTGAPVCGLRPVRAFDLDVLNDPKPGHPIFSPVRAVLTTTSKSAPIARSASDLLTPDAWETASINSALVMSLIPLRIRGSL